MRGSRYTIGIVILAIATAVALFILFRLITNSPQTANTSITVTGITTCLPHKNVDGGPTTLECALGLQADDGRYYALQTNDQDLSTRPTNTRIEVKGSLAEPSPDEKYDIAGRITVESYSVKINGVDYFIGPR